MRNSAIISLVAAILPWLTSTVRGQNFPPIGEWDGVTASAKLEGPYEDPKQMNVPFGAFCN